MKISKITKAALAAAALTLCGAGLTAAGQQGEFVSNTDASTRACFRVDRVEGFASVKFDNVTDGANLRVRNDVYQVQFATPCPAIREATRIAIDSRTPVFVCSGADADIVAYSTIATPQRCRISGLRKIEAAEVASIPAKERP